MIEYVFYAKQKDDPDYKEFIIGVERTPPTPEQTKKIIGLCLDQGREFVRVAEINLSEPPDFTKAVRS